MMVAAAPVAAPNESGNVNSPMGVQQWDPKNAIDEVVAFIGYVSPNVPGVVQLLPVMMEANCLV